MDEKSKSKFPQYLSANDLKNIYLQEVFDFWHLLRSKVSE